MLPVAAAAALGLQFAGLYLPLFRELLHTQPLTALDLAVVFAASTLGYAAVRLDRILFRRKHSPAGQRLSGCTQPARSARDDCWRPSATALSARQANAATCRTARVPCGSVSPNSTNPAAMGRRWSPWSPCPPRSARRPAGRPTAARWYRPRRPR